MIHSQTAENVTVVNTNTLTKPGCLVTPEKKFELFWDQKR